MLVPPKPWTTVSTDAAFIVSEEKVLFSASRVCTGGLLLNNFIFKKPLQKRPNLGHKHQLAVSSDVLNAVNKQQNVSFCVNKEQLFF